MRFPNCILKVLILSLSLAGYLSAAEATAKVHFVNGDVTRKTLKKPDWAKVRIGNRINMTDVMKTELESEATLNMPDGSMVTLTENSQVQFSELMMEDGSFQTTLDVITGRLVFSAQKQSKNSNFKFKTGTMAAAIRGTDGCIDGGDIMIAGLSTGALQIEMFSSLADFLHYCFHRFVYNICIMLFYTCCHYMDKAPDTSCIRLYIKRFHRTNVPCV